MHLYRFQFKTKPILCVWHTARIRRVDKCVVWISFNGQYLNLLLSVFGVCVCASVCPRVLFVSRVCWVVSFYFYFISVIPCGSYIKGHFRLAQCVIRAPHSKSIGTWGERQTKSDKTRIKCGGCFGPAWRSSIGQRIFGSNGNWNEKKKQNTSRRHHAYFFWCVVVDVVFVVVVVISLYICPVCVFFPSE